MAMGSGLLLVLDLLLLFLYYCALFFFYPRPRLFSRFVQTFFFRRFGFEKRVSNFNSRYTGTQCRCALRYLEGTPVLYGILVSATEVRRGEMYGMGFSFHGLIRWHFQLSSQPVSRLTSSPINYKL